MSDSPFLIKDALKYGWIEFKSKYRLFLLATLYYLLPMLITVLIPNYLLPNESDKFYNGLDFIFTIFQMGLTLGITRILLNIYDKKKYNINQMFMEFTYLPKYFLSSLILFIIVIISCLALVLPAIFLIITTQFYYYFIIEENSGIIQCIIKSIKLAIPHFWKLLLFEIAFLGLNVLGLAALGIGFIVTIWISIIANVYVFRKLTKENLNKAELS